MFLRKILFLFLSLAAFGYAATVVFSQESGSRIQVTGAIAIRESRSFPPAILNDVLVEMASRILFTGALANRESLVLYPSALDTLILDSYIDRIIIQGASANRIADLERPPFLPDVVVQQEPTVTETVTTAPTLTSTATLAPTGMPTIEVVLAATATDETSALELDMPETDTQASMTSPASSPMLDSLNTPDTTGEIGTPIAEITATSPRVEPPPEVQAAWITNLGVIVAAIIAAVVTYLVAKEKRKG